MSPHVFIIMFCIVFFVMLMIEPMIDRLLHKIHDYLNQKEEEQND
jgi:hypothetical protein